MKTCYYQLLGVDKKATNTEIKQSYRKLALKYHPDKNSEEDAKQIFVQLTEAYNVLSDPNERTWYDTNREKILFNKDDMDDEELKMYSFGFNIWAYFTTSSFKGYDDSAGAFYQVYRGVFEKLKTEEAKAYAMRDDLEEEMRKYEGFGDSATVIEKVLKFYEDWDNFTTYKTFVWAQDWDTREAPNRYVKRGMQKQNKKQRLKQKKAYIKTIKDLVAFLRKRDPRYRQYSMKLKEQEEQKQKQKKLKEEEKKKEKEEMKKVKQQIQEQRFKEIEEYYRQQSSQIEQNQPVNKANKNKKNEPVVESQEQEQEKFLCEICDKYFKSHNQLQNHQKSKAHKQNIKLLQKQVMLKEELILQVKKSLESEIPNQPVSKKSKNRKKKKNKNKNEEVSSSSEEENVPTPVIEEVIKEKKKEVKKQSSDSDDDADAFMEAMIGKKKREEVEQEVPKAKNKKIEQSSSDKEENGQNEQKKGKAKLRKQKKLANKQKESEFKCQVCSQNFPSKTKLFEHIKKLNHAKAK